ncbi:MAG: DAK2 domain-containing protein, partial [Firmicutes bacterium]|nr:DAK2 domain-containing protein [Bacillota bacterium]
PQGISAALAFDQNISCEQNSNNMIDCIKKVNTGHITYAARDSEFGGFRIKKGDIIALKDGKLKIVENDPIEAAKKLLKLMIKKETRFVTIIYGKDITEEKALILQLDINKKFKNIDTPIIEGGGDLYYFIISVE